MARTETQKRGDSAGRGNGAAQAHAAVAEVSQEFEARQVLKAYRRGLISDELFAEQMREIGVFPAATRTYQINGRAYATERKMLVSFLDKFRAGECFAASVIPLWIERCRIAELKGGLRTVCHREAMHGQLLEERLRELGGELRASVPSEEQERVRACFGSTELTDADKLRQFLADTPDVASAVRPIQVVIAQIDTDLETRALLETVCEDEAATIRWLLGVCERLSQSPTLAAHERRARAATPTLL